MAKKTVFEEMGEALIREAESVDVPLPDFYEGLRDIKILIEDRLSVGVEELRGLETNDGET